MTYVASASATVAGLLLELPSVMTISILGTPGLSPACAKYTYFYIDILIYIYYLKGRENCISN